MRTPMSQAQLGLLVLFSSFLAPFAASAQSAVSAPSAASNGVPVALKITGSSQTYAGQASAFQALASYADGTTRDVTASASWAALQTAVASVSAGAFTGRTPGVATLRASYGGVEAVLPVFVLNGKATHLLQVYPSMSQGQIQAAINASSPGDVVYFTAGTYRITWQPINGLRFLPGRTYFGSLNGAAVLAGTGGYALVTFAGAGVVIQNFVFDGGNLDLTGPVSGVNAEYNIFQNIDAGYTNWTTTNAIFMDTSAANSDFSYNTFRNIGASVLNRFQDSSNASAMQGYGLSAVTIEYNNFDTYDEGIHIFYDRLDGRGVKISHNTFTNGHRIAIEQQDGAAADVEIAYNTVTNPLNPWALTYALSIATNGSTGLSVHDNLLNGNKPLASACTGSGCHYGYGIEAAGINTRVFNNVVEGGWANGVAIGISQNLSVLNNILCGPFMSQNNGYIVNELGSQPGTVVTGNVLSSASACDGLQASH